MFNCDSDVRAYHNDEVTLPQSERTNMSDHRDANRDRLKSRITIQPSKFIKQGSYAMKTMTKDPDNDYDIDDGVYFTHESLQDSDGNDKAPRAARQMVCDVLADDRFNVQPAVRKNCVRVVYNSGYHVDMPVYRIISGDYELASGDEWVHSRAADVEDWFNQKNMDLSPDESNGRQFRRIVRILKKFARSRATWKSNIASGFTITKLAADYYVPNAAREDQSLRDTMDAIHNQLCFSLEVEHPVTPGTKLTSGYNDSKTAFLRDKLADALNRLEVLDDEDCTSEQASKAWDFVFNTKFFSDRASASSRAATAGVLSNLVSTKMDPKTVNKSGGNRFA